MGWRNREVELKLEILNGSKDVGAIATQVSAALGGAVTDTIVGNRIDEYWPPRPGWRADFIRLRKLDEVGYQLTAKHTDKKNKGNLNRVEIDVRVMERKQIRRFLTYVFGPSKGTISKYYHVLLLGSHDVTASVYKVKGIPYLFMELEARTERQVYKLKEKIERRTGLRTKRIPHSLYKLVLCGKGKRR